MVGLPDGLGAFDNGDGTFTLLANHGLAASAGSVRAHGARGSFVSKWTIDKNTQRVSKGADLIQSVSLYNPNNGKWRAAAQGVVFSDFHPADLPEVEALWKERIFLGGEASGDEGRAVAHVVTGNNAGVSYELPHLGKFKHENTLANPGTGDVTLVAGIDGSDDGQLYFFYGPKLASGNVLEKSGLSAGTLYGLKVDGLAHEDDSVTVSTRNFSLVSLGDVSKTTGAALQTASAAVGVTGFQRPRDGSWNKTRRRHGIRRSASARHR